MQPLSVIQFAMAHLDGSHGFELSKSDKGKNRIVWAKRQAEDFAAIWRQLESQYSRTPTVGKTLVIQGLKDLMRASGWPAAGKKRKSKSDPFQDGALDETDNFNESSGAEPKGA